jgi:hypothetical protein
VLGSRSPVSIDECEFKLDVKFEDVDALERFYISDSKFGKKTSFQDLGAYGGLVLSRSVFGDDVEFSGQFDREAIFLNNLFNGFVDFGSAYFSAPLILKNNVFKNRPAIDKIHLSYTPIMPEDQLGGGLASVMRYYSFLHRLSNINRFLARFVAKTLAIAKTDESYPSLRQFRLVAQEYDDRRLALDIYVLEQKSRRIWFDHPLSAGFIFGLLFQIFSDFGRSILRPLTALAVLTVGCTGLFFLASSKEDCFGPEKLESVVLLSVNNTLPFLAWQKQTLMTRSEVCLFGPAGLTATYGLMSIVQSILSVFLILIGLAVRNMFKMQS